MIRRIIEAIDEVELEPSDALAKPGGFERITDLLTREGWTQLGAPEADHESPDEAMVYTFVHPAIGDNTVNVKVGSIGGDAVDSVFVNEPSDAYEVPQHLAAVRKAVRSLVSELGGGV